MTREITSSTTLTADVGALVAVHHMRPAWSFPALIAAAERPGPVRAAVEHMRECVVCRIAAREPGVLCEAGLAFVRKIRPRQEQPRKIAAPRSAE